jgi:hypothetical protein
MVLVRLSPDLPFSVPFSQTNRLPSSTVISAFAILILGIIGLLFKAEHPELVGGDEDPEDGSQVAGTVFLAVLIYAVSGKPAAMRLVSWVVDILLTRRKIQGFLVFCGIQGVLHMRESRRGAIAL